ncbi:hypothetical protein BDW22DRAFT_1421916 [Trametopsis cervina]|nr:hypothetical protein BDW22DRAFT_1421916 [Trametopsis cervina]
MTNIPLPATCLPTPSLQRTRYARGDATGNAAMVCGKRKLRKTLPGLSITALTASSGITQSTALGYKRRVTEQHQVNGLDQRGLCVCLPSNDVLGGAGGIYRDVPRPRSPWPQLQTMPQNTRAFRHSLPQSHYTTQGPEATLAEVASGGTLKTESSWVIAIECAQNCSRKTLRMITAFEYPSAPP